jgi:hypothetical protein
MFQELSDCSVAWKMSNRRSWSAQADMAIPMPETKEAISALSAEFGCSQGEVVDYLVLFREAQLAEQPAICRATGGKVVRAVSGKRPATRRKA